MSGLHELPGHVFRMIESGVVAEFATVTTTVVPIERRNPKVGLLIEGRPEEPVIVIRAHAAVRDGDIQSNAIRYLAETGYKGISHGITWQQARLALTYWSRIIIENTPERIYWWDDHAALDAAPSAWNAHSGTVWPRSDRAPHDPVSPGNWTARPWAVVAADAVASGHRCHLSVLDADGFPLPMRTNSFELVEEGFQLSMPKGSRGLWQAWLRSLLPASARLSAGPNRKATQCCSALNGRYRSIR